MITRIPDIDADHERMGDGIEQIARLCVQHEKHKILAALSGLEALSAEHFAREEELMRRSGYARLFEHAEKHYLLLRFLRNLIQMVDSDSLRCDETVVQILRDWRDNHIETSDADYADFVTRRGTDGRL